MMTDTQLEQIARQAVGQCRLGGGRTSEEIILTALKSVRDASTGSPSTPSGEPAAAAANRELVASHSTDTRTYGELRNRLHDAENLLHRGIATLNRTGWERGETDDEWRMAAQKWVNAQILEREIFPETTVRCPYCGNSARWKRKCKKCGGLGVVGAQAEVRDTPTKDEGDEGLRRECSGLLPGRNVTVVQTGEKTLFVSNPKARE